jgi:hypothetical protein
VFDDSEQKTGDETPVSFGLLLRDSRRGGGRFLEAVGTAKLLAEPFHAAGGVDKLLLTGEKRMAGIADIDVDLRLRAASHESISAGTTNVAGDIPGMNLGFHDQTPCSDVRQ